MRPIKFRIWDRQCKKFVSNSNSLHCQSNWALLAFSGEVVDFVNFLDGDHGGAIEPVRNPRYYADKTKLIKRKRYIETQYTGNKDKHGKEIYEGDIVETFIYGRPSPVFFKVEYVKNRFVPDVITDKSYVEVIGNLFENPKLVRKYGLCTN